MEYRLELLILGIILVIVSYIPFIPYPLDVFCFWIGIIVLVIWLILLVLLLVRRA